MSTDATHDPRLRSWVESANDGLTDFPIQNLPLGIFARDSKDRGSVCTRVGDTVIDISALQAARRFSGDAAKAAESCAGASLNALMVLPPRYTRALRTALSELLRAGSPMEGDRDLRARAMVSVAQGLMRMPAVIGDYTDFYASVHHATNVGALFRPDQPLLPNYKWVPIGYHGRSSSIVLSGTPVVRPRGQTKGPEAAAPSFGPSRSMDYETELGFFIGTGNEQSRPVEVGDADLHIFGFCLVNDWSARDIQAWEYQPLGPFLAKNFATAISPWVVTRDALAPFRAPLVPRAQGDPSPLPYLNEGAAEAVAGVDVTLETWLSSRRMRGSGKEAMLLGKVSTRELFWSPGQMVAHHTSGGCNLRPGDLLASGTVSGPTPGSLGCMLEMTRRGAAPITLPTGEQRSFLEDGDQITLKGYCVREGRVRIGFGECRGEVHAAASHTEPRPVV